MNANELVSSRARAQQERDQNSAWGQLMRDDAAKNQREAQDPLEHLTPQARAAFLAFQQSPEFHQLEPYDRNHFSTYAAADPLTANLFNAGLSADSILKVLRPVWHDQDLPEHQTGPYLAANAQLIGKPLPNVYGINSSNGYGPSINPIQGMTLQPGGGSYAYPNSSQPPPSPTAALPVALGLAMRNKPPISAFSRAPTP